MKNLKLILALVLFVIGFLAMAAYAANVVPANSPQFGNVNFTNVWTRTNSFPVTYSTPPIVSFSSSSTSAYPITNNFVTTSNFSVSVANTNVQLQWYAAQGYPRVTYGTNAVQPALLVTNTFGFTYAYNPSVTIAGQGLSYPATATNSMVTLTNVSTTGFVLVYPNAQATNQVILWQAIGVASAPGPNGVVTY